jgi:hypothetical protein
MEPLRDPRAPRRPEPAGVDPRLDDDIEELEEPRSVADELIDELLPPELDWRRIVRRHPIPSLIVAAAGGYLLARARGPKLVTALAELAAIEVGGRVSERLAALEDAADDELL